MNSHSNTFTTTLLKNGFVPLSHKDHFNQTLTGVYYALRKRNNVHEYISLMFYTDKFIGKSSSEIEELESTLTDNNFCEAVWELFTTSKNTRVKGNPNPSERIHRGFDAVETKMFRCLSDVQLICQQSHEQNELLIKNLKK